MAVFRSLKSCIQTQASATLARSVLNGSFEGLAMNKAWRRQSSAEWAARAVTDLCDENKAWTTGWRPLRAHSDAHFKEAVAEAAALHSRDELFSKHIEPEPAPEDPWTKPLAEASDDEDDAPMPDAPPEPEIIDMPPALVELGALHRIALGVRRWTALMCPQKKYHLHHITSCSLLSHVSVVPYCPLSRMSLFCVSCPGSQTVRQEGLLSVFFFFAMASKSVDTR